MQHGAASSADRNSWRRRPRSVQRLRRPELVFTATTKILSSSREPLEQMLLKARQLAAAGDISGAHATALAAATIHPQASIAAYMHGALSLQLGEPQAAVPSLEHALHLDPTNWRAATNLATALLQCDRAAEAVVAARAATRAQPSFVAARVVLSQALRAQGETNKALAEAHRALALKEHKSAAIPDDDAHESALLSLGELLVELNALAEAWALALHMAESAGHADPRMARACTLAGLVQEANGQLEAALAAYEKAAKLDPSHPHASARRTSLIPRALRASLPALPGDVFIATYPKSGTTWMQQAVMCMCACAHGACAHGACAHGACAHGACAWCMRMLHVHMLHVHRVRVHIGAHVSQRSPSHRVTPHTIASHPMPCHPITAFALRAPYHLIPPKPDPASPHRLPPHPAHTHPPRILPPCASHAASAPPRPIFTSSLHGLVAAHGWHRS